jgi:hypothetical protein
MLDTGAINKAKQAKQQSAPQPDPWKKIAAVAIPVHKEIPDKFEEISIRQCLKVLQHHHIFIFSRSGFDFRNYQELIEGYGNVYFITFDYVEGVEGYNDLMLSPRFYKYFLPYTFLLIHHTDAFVFRDSLYFWCSQGFDYIGASMFYKPFTDITINSSLSLKVFYGLGLLRNRQNVCGGFSLRRVKKLYLMSRYFKPKGKINEDLFWAFTAPARNPFFRVPRHEKVTNFAYGDYPEEQYVMNNFILPFGCHDWYQRNFNFWGPIIRRQGYEWPEPEVEPKP